MDVDTAIRTRRTHKQFSSHPVDATTVRELLDVARWAPNHHLTQPWRFRVLGPETLARLRALGGEKEAAKLDRAPTHVLVSAKLSGVPLTDEEDLHATAAAAYAILLAAHARGLGSYWRTPELLRSDAGREAVGLADDERFVALIYLGTAVGEPPPKERQPVEALTKFLP
jgi:nitroreductase